jgi:hypothetical protein
VPTTHVVDATALHSVTSVSHRPSMRAGGKLLLMTLVSAVGSPPHSGLIAAGSTPPRMPSAPGLREGIAAPSRCFA